MFVKIPETYFPLLIDGDTVLAVDDIALLLIKVVGLLDEVDK